MISKYDVLKFIEEYEVIGPRELANYYGMKYDWATKRIKRLYTTVLIEPLGIETERWVLSVKAYNKLDYLKQREDE